MTLLSFLWACKVSESYSNHENGAGIGIAY